MSQPAVIVDHLWKRYHKRFGASTLWSFFGKRERTDDEFWALRDISFEVRPGECLGIIGPNGSGKSTLLKILSRITKPTRGQARVNGRVASLLEVGTGFHPELTGRENVYLSGAVLGMRKTDIRKRFDEIVQFSGVEEFIDVPVKRYSSGMYVRLAFAVAAHIDTDILICDEVLAVGDAEFQKKCLGAMGEAGQRGRAVLLVSHNMEAVTGACRRAICLQKGAIGFEGPAGEVVQRYIEGNASCNSGEMDVTEPSFHDEAHTYPAGLFRWKKISLSNSRGEISAAVFLGEPFELVFEGCATEALSDVRAGFGIYSATGTVVCNSWSADQGLRTRLSAGDVCFRARIDPNFLAPGSYKLQLALFGPRADDLVGWFPFSVSPLSQDPNRAWHKDRRGIIDVPCRWKIVKG